VHRMLTARFERGRGLRERRLVFIGESPLTQAIVRQIEQHPVLGYRVVETFPPEAASDPAMMRKTMDMLRDGTADEVLFGTAAGSYQHLVELVALFRGAGAELKRTVDVVLSALALVLLCPVFIAVAAAVKLDSPGPVLFRRRCLGRGGMVFEVLKFRSMVADAHEILERTPAFLEEYRRSLKVKDDPRVTRVGRFLRRTSLDELPQLINVFAGEMSLVGPRMLGDIELEKYGEFRDKVLSIRPGITGLWQVSGRHETTFDERLAMDNTYIDRWSIGLDFLILFKTIPAVLRMRGAQ
jgi:lipopolysaccharide/colanic/teichoic acid biosynthesis glycosyltransferase